MQRRVSRRTSRWLALDEAPSVPEGHWKLAGGEASPPQAAEREPPDRVRNKNAPRRGAGKHAGFPAPLPGRIPDGPFRWFSLRLTTGYFPLSLRDVSHR